MIKKLRLRFVLVAILSTLLTLVILMSAINITNYRKVVDDADRYMEMTMRDAPRPPDPMSRNMRDFSVLLGNDGSILSCDTVKMAEISEEEAGDLALEAYNGSDDHGFIGDYRYSVTRTGNETLVIFCDCGPGLDNFRNFLFSSIIASLGCLLLVSIAATLFSGIAVRPIVESYEKQKRFITDAGHEIRTPLAIICADADVLTATTGEDNEWVNDIKLQTRRLSSLTDDLIRLSKMEEGRSSLKMADVDLSSLAREKANSFKAIAVTGNRNIKEDIEGEVTVSGDSKALEQLISILLDNAVKYSPEGGDIAVKCFKDGKNGRLEVSNDTASDISDDQLESLFDRFYRVDPSRSKETGGHGIGLSVAKAVAEAHGGSICARKDGEEIRFEVSIPLKR